MKLCLLILKILILDLVFHELFPPSQLASCVCLCLVKWMFVARKVRHLYVDRVYVGIHPALVSG